MTTSSSTTPIKFMKGSYPIQKYAIEDYLTYDLRNFIFQYAKEHYVFPKMSEEQERAVVRLFEADAPSLKFSREIFKNEKVAKRFIRYLESNVSNNGSDTFSYTCRTATENGIFFYAPNASKNSYDERQNKDLVRIFSPLLNEWANDCALKVEDLFEQVSLTKENEELTQLKALAKKYGKKLV